VAVRMTSIEKSSDFIGNRTHDLPASRIVPTACPSKSIVLTENAGKEIKVVKEIKHGRGSMKGEETKEIILH
jgi:hypothetical protein